MVITTLLVLVAVVVCLRVLRVVTVRFGLDVRESLVWFGLAEIPAPPVSRRPGRGAPAAPQAHRFAD